MRSAHSAKSEAISQICCVRCHLTSPPAWRILAILVLPVSPQENKNAAYPEHRLTSVASRNCLHPVAANSHRQWRDISHTSLLFLQVSPMSPNCRASVLQTGRQFGDGTLGSPEGWR